MPYLVIVNGCLQGEGATEDEAWADAYQLAGGKEEWDAVMYPPTEEWERPKEVDIRCVACTEALLTDRAFNHDLKWWYLRNGTACTEAEAQG